MRVSHPHWERATPEQVRGGPQKDGTWVLKKYEFGSSNYFFVEYLTVCHVSVVEVDTWHYIKKNKKIKSIKIN
jgi:hypothetical protein